MEDQRNKIKSCKREVEITKTDCHKTQKRKPHPCATEYFTIKQDARITISYKCDWDVPYGTVQ
jgi:hypothetical protein